MERVTLRLLKDNGIEDVEVRQGLSDQYYYSPTWLHKHYAPDLSPDEPRELRVWGPWCVDMRELSEGACKYFGKRMGNPTGIFAEFWSIVEHACQAALDWHAAQEQPTPAPDPSSPLVDVSSMLDWERTFYLTAQFPEDHFFQRRVQHAVRCWDAREKKGGAA